MKLAVRDHAGNFGPRAALVRNCGWAVVTPIAFHMFAAIAFRVGNHEHNVYTVRMTISGSNG